jgi:branched-subunit amino acid aminotransferase/4-amino-4-deoxychorismate lyase
MATVLARGGPRSSPRLQGFLDCIKELVKVDRDWIPKGDGYSLYLRPTVIATWPYLGVSVAKSFKLYCIASPVGPYYPEGALVLVLAGGRSRD